MGERSKNPLKTDPQKTAKRAKKKFDMDRFFTEVIELMTRTNPRTLNYSKISRHTGIPRPTLYYYFGKSVESVIEEAVKFGMKHFAQLYESDSQLQAKSFREFQRNRFLKSLAIVRDFPWAPGMFFFFRNDKGALGNQIRRLEKDYFDLIAKAWRKFYGTDTSVLAIRQATYFKIGTLYGYANDIEEWMKLPYEATENMVESMIDYCTELMHSHTRKSKA